MRYYQNIDQLSSTGVEVGRDKEFVYPDVLVIL